MVGLEFLDALVLFRCQIGVIALGSFFCGVLVASAAIVKGW